MAHFSIQYSLTLGIAALSATILHAQSAPIQDPIDRILAQQAEQNGEAVQAEQPQHTSPNTEANNEAEPATETLETIAILGEDIIFSDLLEQFQHVCFAQFPDENAFFERLDRNDNVYFPDMAKPYIWQNGAITLRYVGASNSRTNIPYPQCIMSAKFTSDQDHLGMKNQVESAIEISNGKSSGKKGNNRTIWNFTANGHDMRMFFNSRKFTDNHYDASLIIINLGKESTAE